jgi:hypothetical protein
MLHIYYRHLIIVKNEMFHKLTGNCQKKQSHYILKLRIFAQELSSHWDCCNVLDLRVFIFRSYVINVAENWNKLRGSLFQGSLENEELLSLKCSRSPQVITVSKTSLRGRCHQIVKYTYIPTRSSESYQILFPTYDANQNRHIGDLIFLPLPA